MPTAEIARGETIRKEVLGEARFQQTVGGATDFDRPFQNFVSEYCWGSGWGRGVLSRQQRSMLTLGRSAEFEAHFRAAVTNLKIPLDELREVLFHIAIHCGVPAGVESFRIARRVLSEDVMPSPAAKRAPEPR